MIQFKEIAWTDGRTDGRTEGWKDGQTLFYRTLPATAGGPINWGDLYYSFGTSSKNCKVAQNLCWVSLDENTESNLQLLKDKMLNVNNFFLFDFVLFFDRQRAFSKLPFVSTYVSITNNLKLTTTFLTMKSILWKIQVLRHNNGFRIGILF